MSKLLHILFCVGFIIGTYAKTVDEMKTWFLQKGMECSKEHSVPPDDMKMLQEHKLPDNQNAKCLLACVYGKAKWLDDKGMFDYESATTMLEKEHADDTIQLEKSKKLFDLCKKVNDEPVNDDKGCDRSGHLFICLTENASKEECKSLVVVDIILCGIYTTIITHSLRFLNDDYLLCS